MGRRGGGKRGQGLRNPVVRRKAPGEGISQRTGRSGRAPPGPGCRAEVGARRRASAGLTEPGGSPAALPGRPAVPLFPPPRPPAAKGSEAPGGFLISAQGAGGENPTECIAPFADGEARRACPSKPRQPPAAPAPRILKKRQVAIDPPSLRKNLSPRFTAKRQECIFFIYTILRYKGSTFASTVQIFVGQLPRSRAGCFSP